ncbi:MAG TPA: NUDIX hydrolase [Candidatus Hydrogenedentes bacterium]|nr:NUDIX hydrolase [Candidatus Hydrogenedentota bacterium]HOS01782.1 NUDIX hydrolase [Candidatus Hydrogenedentota bacterium]
MHNPWKTLSSKPIYRNPWFSVREDQVTRPDGRPGIYGVVETRIATGAVAVTGDGEVYLVGQYRYPLDCYSWEVPEGGAEEGEDPLTAIQRELREEAGIVARTWTPLGGAIHLSNCISSETGYVFLAEDLTETDADPDETELLCVRKVPFAQALAMVDANEITDAVSIIALLRADRYLRSRS